MENFESKNEYIPSKYKMIKDNETLDNYIKELYNDTKLTQVNLREKSLMVSSLKTKWLNYLFHERELLHRAKAKKESIIKKNIGSVQKSILNMKSEHALENNNETIKTINLYIDMSKNNIEFIERALDAIDSLMWDIKNSIEIVKLGG